MDDKPKAERHTVILWPDDAQRAEAVRQMIAAQFPVKKRVTMSDVVRWLLAQKVPADSPAQEDHDGR